MKIRRIIPVLLIALLALTACTKNDKAGSKEAAEATPTTKPSPTATPTPIEPDSEEDIALAKYIQSILYMAPHSEVDGLFVHQDPDSMEYLSEIVGTRVELTAAAVDENLFYRYIAFTMGVSSFSELSDRLETKRATGKIYFTFTYPFTDARRDVIVEVDGTDIAIY